MRVLSLVDEPPERAVAPVAAPGEGRGGGLAGYAPFVAQARGLRLDAPFGCAPIAAAAGSPSLKRTIVGIDAIP